MYRVIVTGCLALALAAVGCGRLDDSPSQPQSQGVPQSGQQAGATLTCPEEEGSVNYEAFIGDDHPGGPATPREAVVQLLAREGGPSNAELGVAASTDTAAQIVADRQGARVFTAFVEKVGDSWYVTEFFACADWIRPGQTHDEEERGDS